jgi:putative NIF3 family GTP cyclohydrolase 1 type 2
MTHTVRDVLHALHRISRGRVVVEAADLLFSNNACVVTKTSHIPGKAVTELPGLVVGRLDDAVGKVGLVMSLTENFIELAGALEIDVLIVHHPVADAASSGGVLLRDYLDLYGISLFEFHEAFHGTHPGVSYLHGFVAKTIYTSYLGNPGVNVYVGEVLPGIHTLGDMCGRVERLMNVREEDEMLLAERRVRNDHQLEETLVRTKVEILLGSKDSPVSRVVQFAPHSGFNPALLEQILRSHPDIDTLIAAKGRLRRDHPLVGKAKTLGLNVLNGNSHGYEIYENWMPLAAALESLLPGIPLYLLRERVTATLTTGVGTPELREYARLMADTHLLTSKAPK